MMKSWPILNVLWVSIPFYEYETKMEWRWTK
jgi:hypothetical protein